MTKSNKSPSIGSGGLHVAASGEVYMEDVILKNLREGATNWGHSLRNILINMNRRIAGLEMLLVAISEEAEALQKHAPKTFSVVAKITIGNMDEDK